MGSGVIAQPISFARATNARAQAPWVMWSGSSATPRSVGASPAGTKTWPTGVK